MRKIALTAVIVAVLVTTGLGVPVYAARDDSGAQGGPAVTRASFDRPGPHHGHMMKGRHSLGAVLKKLGVTDEQKKQIRGLVVEAKERTRKSRADLISLIDEKKTMLMSGKIDQSKLSGIDEKIVKLSGDLMRERMKTRREILALLTPEQVERMADLLLEKSGPGGFGKMGRGGHRGMF